MRRRIRATVEGREGGRTVGVGLEVLHLADHVIKITVTQLCHVLADLREGGREGGREGEVDVCWEEEREGGREGG